MKKNILIFYPHNLFRKQMGIDHRYIQLIRYFKARNFRVELFSLENFVTSWDHQDPRQENLLDEVYLYDFRQGPVKKQTWVGRLFAGFANNKKPPAKFSRLPDYTSPGMKRQFNDILSRKDYDFVLISYVYWAALIETQRARQGEIVLDLSDFTTLNLFDMAEGRIDIGGLMAEEIRRINLFAKVICISADECSLFSRFCPKPEFHFVPFFMKADEGEEDTAKEFDLLFIGSDNVFNQKGIAWFFSQVQPLLFKMLDMAVVGRVAAHVPRLPHVTRIPFADDVAALYRKSRVAICPLLGGTGMKIKVIEGLSFGLPVVTTSRGVCGLPQKVANGCIIADSPADFAAGIQRLIEDKAFYREQSVRSRSFFREYFEESRVIRELDRVFLPECERGVP